VAQSGLPADHQTFTPACLTAFAGKRHWPLGIEFLAIFALISMGRF
jgi:hypothetical protein